MKGELHMKKIVLYLSVFLLVLTGCGNVVDPVGEIDQAEVQQSDGVEIVASEKSLPDAFHELSFQREEVPLFNYLARMVDNQAAFEEEWKLFNMSSEMPVVDFNMNKVIFIGLTESGSCPYLNEDIVIEWDNEEMMMRLLESSEICTADASPRTVVIEVTKDRLHNLQTVTILEGNVSTQVPINEY